MYDFVFQLSALRIQEVAYLKKIAYMMAIGTGLVIQSVPLFMPVIVFLSYVALGNELTSSKAYTTLALLNFMQIPFLFIPLGEIFFSLYACDRIIYLQTIIVRYNCCMLFLLHPMILQVYLNTTKAVSPWIAFLRS
jgi:hypothetical protein